MPEHRERIKEPMMFLSRAFLRYLNCNGWARAHGNCVDTRQTRHAHAEAAMVGHHINDRLARGLVLKARTDLSVHRVERSRKKLCNKRGVTIGMANDEVLNFDAIP